MCRWCDESTIHAGWWLVECWLSRINDDPWIITGSLMVDRWLMMALNTIISSIVWRYLPSIIGWLTNAESQPKLGTANLPTSEPHTQLSMYSRATCTQPDSWKGACRYVTSEVYAGQCSSMEPNAMCTLKNCSRNSRLLLRDTPHSWPNKSLSPCERTWFHSRVANSSNTNLRNEEFTKFIYLF